MNISTRLFRLRKIAHQLSDEQYQLWKKWKQTGNQQYYTELLHSLDPMIQSYVNKYSLAPVPRSALEAEAYRLAAEAITRYDDTHGTAISSYVGQWLQKLQRFVIAHQNVGRFSERALNDVNTLRNVEEQLSTSLGRTPTNDELSQELGWPISKVISVRRMGSKDILGGDVESEEGSVWGDIDYSKQINLEYLYNDLNKDEKQLFEQLTGYNGQQPKSLVQISKETGIPYHELNRKKEQLAQKIDMYINL